MRAPFFRRLTQGWCVEVFEGTASGVDWSVPCHLEHIVGCSIIGQNQSCYYFIAAVVILLFVISLFSLFKSTSSTRFSPRLNELLATLRSRVFVLCSSTIRFSLVSFGLAVSEQH